MLCATHCGRSQPSFKMGRSPESCFFQYASCPRKRWNFDRDIAAARLRNLPTVTVTSGKGESFPRQNHDQNVKLSAKIAVTRCRIKCDEASKRASMWRSETEHRESHQWSVLEADGIRFFLTRKTFGFCFGVRHLTQVEYFQLEWFRGELCAGQENLR